MTLFDHLPPRATWGGYVYLAAFNNPLRTVKVGSTIHPTSRLADHRLDADAFGHEIIDTWVSSEHLNYLETENEMIRLAGSISTGRARREYFHHIDFDALVKLAQGVDFSARQTIAVGVSKPCFTCGAVAA